MKDLCKENFCYFDYVKKGDDSSPTQLFEYETNDYQVDYKHHNKHSSKLDVN